MPIIPTLMPIIPNAEKQMPWLAFPAAREGSLRPNSAPTKPHIVRRSWRCLVLWALCGAFGALLSVLDLDISLVMIAVMSVTLDTMFVIAGYCDVFTHEVLSILATFLPYFAISPA